MNKKIKKIMTILSIFMLLLFLTSCRASFKPNVRVTGNKAPKSPTVLLLTDCYSSDNNCEDSFIEGVNGILRSELQFLGYKTIEPKNLIKDSRTRDEKSGNISLLGVGIISAKSKEQTGALYEDLSPKDKEKVLKDAKATGIISSSINMLAKSNSSNWIVEVQIAYKTGKDNDLVWISKCKHESFWNEKNSWSIEEATKCAVKGLKSKIKGKNIEKENLKTIAKANKNYPIMLKIKGNIKIQNDFRDGVEEVLTSMGYSLVDEAVQEKVLKEQQEQQKTECYEDSCLVDTGKMLAAKALIVVTVEKRGDKSYKFRARFIDFEKGTTIKTIAKYFDFSLKNYKEMMKFGKILTKELFEN